MMKIKYIIIAFMTVLCGVMISCEDFVQEEPKGLLTPDNFFGNEAEAILALNGLQASAQTGGGIGDMCGTDIGVIGRSAIPGGWVSAVYMHDVTYGGSWANQYAAIRNANLVLAGLEKSSLPDDIKNRCIAQALFYRAMFYFVLTTDYGDCVYWTDELIMEDVAYLGKTDANVIQQAMIGDLENALSLNSLPTGMWKDNNALPTEWSVRMLKAYFHIWQEEWAEARTELIEVTANSPHKLNPDYADMYRQGHELHEEIVFGVEFSKTETTLTNRSHEGFHYNLAAENANAIKAMNEAGVFTRSASNTLRKSFADTYDANDARRLYNVWDTMTLANGTLATFNCIYIPKKMRAPVPLSDPLMQVSDANFSSAEPGRTFLLSDAWLLLTEADLMETENASSPVAIAAINEIRARTNLPDYASITMEDIRNERAWELCAEGFMGRKKDLLRWGILESTVLATPAKELAAGAYVVSYNRAVAEAAAIAAAPGKWLYFPIPLAEIERSADIGGALVQNPLWE